MWEHQDIISYLLVGAGFAMNVGAWRQGMKTFQSTLAELKADIASLRNMIVLARERESQLSERVRACEILSKMNKPSDHFEQ